MKKGQPVRFWQWDREGEGDVYTGTFLSHEGNTARVMSGGKEIKVFINYIF